MAGMSLAHRARRAVWHLGLDVQRAGPAPSARLRAALLATHRITVVVDGGANVGGYGKSLRQTGYRERIVSFEPTSAVFGELKRAARRDRRWECRKQALGDRPGTVDINIAGDHSLSSSLLPLTDDDTGYVGTEPVEVVTLDSLALPHDRIALKLDLEGYEPEALDGAAETLPRVRVIEIELALQRSRKARFDYREMLDRLSGLGFSLVGVQPGYTDWRTGRMYEFDAMLERATEYP